MPRTQRETIEEKPEVKEPEQKIVEIEVNLTLLNNKLNYIMSKLDQLTKTE